MGRYKSDTELDLLDKVKLIDDRLSRLERIPGLGSSGVSKGSLIIDSGGNLEIHDGGFLFILDGGGLAIQDGGNLTIQDGGGMGIHDGGVFGATYASGRAACGFGSIFDASDPDFVLGHGLIIQDDTVAGEDVFRAMRFFNGQTMVLTGETGIPIDVVNMYALNSVIEGTATPGVQLIGPSSTFEVYTTYANTASAANCHLLANGQIMRSTSSRRGKTDIEDLQLDPELILQLRPRVFRDTIEITGGGPTSPEKPTTRRNQEPKPPLPAPPPAARTEKGPLSAGFIAEEVDELGLGVFVTYDAQGLPEGIAYDRISAALLVLIKRQQEQIDELTRRVNILDKGVN